MIENNTVDVNTSCCWFILKNNKKVLGMHSVEGMLLDSKNELYDFISYELNREAKNNGLKFYDFRKKDSLENIDIREMCNFSKLVLSKNATPEDISKFISDLKELKIEKKSTSKHSKNNRHI